jgi:uncharacterized protein YoxC
MNVEKGITSKTIKNVEMELEKLINQTTNILQKTSTIWTDNGQKLFFQKYMNDFYDVQKETVQDLKSIEFEIKHIENILKSKIY